MRVIPPSCSFWPWVKHAVTTCFAVFIGQCHTCQTLPLIDLSRKSCSAWYGKGSHTQTDDVCYCQFSFAIRLVCDLQLPAFISSLQTALSLVQFKLILFWCLAEQEVWFRLIGWNLVFISRGCGCSSLESLSMHVWIFIISEVITLARICIHLHRIPTVCHSEIYR